MAEAAIFALAAPGTPCDHPPMLTCTVTNLSPDAFSPYGEVFNPAGVTARVDQIATLQNMRPAARANLFLARTGLTAIPHAFDRMESHPWSSQSFMPLGDAAIVIAVARPGPGGRPDMVTLKGFIARGAGFSYRAGIWHLPVASLVAGVPILGFMYEDGSPEDCVWAEVGPTRLVEA